MKFLSVICCLFLSLNLSANSGLERAGQLQKLLNNKSNFSHQKMWASGRIGELVTRAKISKMAPDQNITKTKGFVRMVDREIAYMVQSEELFRHEDKKINNLYSLIRSGSYDLIYKTGSVSNGKSPYNSDGIYKDLGSILKERAKSQLKKLVPPYSTLIYLRTWNTDSEYDGMEKFFIQVGNSPYFVIVTIDNCGGC